jgi:predicted transcriptional regulator
MKIAFGKQIATARMHYGISQMKISKQIGRSQWWLSAVERGKVPITESVANKILLAVHKVGGCVRAITLEPGEDFKIGLRSNAKNFKNLKAN